jgi:hypothetical protein
MRLKIFIFVFFLTLLVGSLSYLEIKRFGSLTGFISSNGDLNNENNQDINTTVFGEIFFIIIAFFVLSLGFRFVFNYYSKKNIEKVDLQIVNAKRLIELDLQEPNIS